MRSKKGYLSEQEAIDTLKTMGIEEYDGKVISTENFRRNELLRIIEEQNDITANIPKVEAPKVEKENKESADVEITPKKDWNLHCPPHVSKQLKKDVKTNVPKILLSNLKSEKVID